MFDNSNSNINSNSNSNSNSNINSNNTDVNCYSYLTNIKVGFIRFFHVSLKKCSAMRYCCSYLSSNGCCERERGGGREILKCSVCHNRCAGCLNRFLSEFNCNLDDLEEGYGLGRGPGRGPGCGPGCGPELDNIIIESGEQKLESLQRSTTDMETCIICSDNCSGAVVIPCMHSQFCYSCIEKWQDKNGTCPACREKITDIVQCL